VTVLGDWEGVVHFLSKHGNVFLWYDALWVPVIHQYLEKWLVLHLWCHNWGLSYDLRLLFHSCISVRGLQKRFFSPLSLAWHRLLKCILKQTNLL
jgi:hypothetical protein